MKINRRNIKAILEHICELAIPVTFTIAWFIVFVFKLISLCKQRSNKMKQTSEQSYSEVRETKEAPKPKCNWIANSADLKKLLEEMEKINPWLRSGSRGYFTDNKFKE